MTVLRKIILLLSLVFLASCAYVWQPPSVDLEIFKPAPHDSRILDAPIVSLVIKSNAHEFCSKMIGMRMNGQHKPMACAYWNVLKNECTIVTPPNTATNYVGHELRHCFEGPFHP
jgi:hypothetical protein